MNHGNRGLTGWRARPPAEDAGECLATEWSVEPRLSQTLLLEVLGEERCPLVCSCAARRTTSLTEPDGSPQFHSRATLSSMLCSDRPER
jgi:hypothetical protein